MTTRSKPAFAGAANRSTFRHGEMIRDADWLLRLVDVGLVGIICVAPYFFGGRHELGRFVYVALVAVTAALWFIRQIARPARWNDTAAYGVTLFAIGLLVVQILPLPEAWVHWLAPRNAELLPLWGSSSGLLGSWRTISVVPHETTKALAVLLAHSLLFVVVVQRIGSIADMRRLLRCVGISAVLMASFGLAQYFTSNANFFWFYEVPYRNTYWCICGSFTNRNHFANFLVLGVGPMACWVLEALRQRNVEQLPRRTTPVNGLALMPLALGAALSIVLFAILLSMSRGGLLGLMAAIFVTGLIYAHRRLIDARYMSSAIGLAIVVIGLLSMYGYNQVAQRFSTLAKGSMEAVDSGEGRRQIWRANIASFADGGPIGSGAASHVKIYPVYIPDSRFGQYTHAESGYLQIATETGFIGVMLFVAGLCLCGWWFVTCLRHRQSEPESLYFGAICGGLAASLAHSVVDFVWYIPACMSVTIVLAACLLRLAQFSRAAEPAVEHSPGLADRRFSRGYGLASLVVLVVGGWMTWTFVGPAMASLHWDRYLRVSVANRDASQYELNNLLANRDFSPGTDRNHVAMNQAMTRHLERVLAWDPNFADARLKLANRLLDEFELRQQAAANAMDVAQIRDAVLASKFSSPAELQNWLRRAFGDDCELLARALANAHAGVAHSPLSGEGYLILAKLCFLEGGDRASVKAYIEQGVRVRPHDGDLLYEVGLQELADGQNEIAMRHWKECFQTFGPHQLKVVYSLAGRMPASLFVAEFKPDWQTMRPIWLRYREFGQPQDLIDLVAYAAALTDREIEHADATRAANIWLTLSSMYHDLELDRQELACLQRSYACNSSAFEVRLALGQALLKAGQFAEAEPHFRWCLARRPADKDLSIALGKISDLRRSERKPDGVAEPNVARAWTR